MMKTMTRKTLTRKIDNMVFNTFGMTLYELVMTTAFGILFIMAMAGFVMKTMLLYKLWSIFY